MNKKNGLKTALNRAMALCASREYCSADIRSKLESWGICTTEAEKIISGLIREKFLDDSRYAHAFVRDKFKYNKWGRMKIAAGLRQKKIAEEIIRNALGEIDEARYMDMIRETLNLHRKSVRAKNQYELRGKLLRYGLSKGFENHFLYDILNDLDP
ncbi:MAG TPA: regulatory protein RecX [Bacteroidales bacterium]|jgi:regulatory protein|nr:RecX family transcriptional regulator [Bacteroidales bacterium]HNR42720.1 regulatory protein RecX [Bacteroidales bacterium]HPM17540.1 regulatory protein RecX [Bacteroidales bacterium]HQG76960.1 regulatory protein RecX [Bacteroidales bacterium]